ncbi:MAG: nucleotidyltransferase family protein [Bryobacteraceae bacterium]|nr:nucleotidyltransferase family protein [Bryobacteraceae bacterium]
MATTVKLGPAEIDASKLADVCRRHGVKELYLFGSVARGQSGPGSDVDLMVEFAPGVRVGMIEFETFSDELESLAGRKVDLVTRRGLKPWIRPHVLKEARIIYAA